MKIKLHKLCLLAIAGILAACAETPEGTIVINKETVENFVTEELDHGDGGLKGFNPPSYLNLVMEQPVAHARIPELHEGEIRLQGTLDSAGPYKVAGVAGERGSTFGDSVFGMLGPAGRAGNAWFYADIKADTGEILSARAYLYGFNGGVCDMRKKDGDSFGQIGRAGFTIQVSGPCYFPEVSGSVAEFALLIQGSGNVLAKPENITLKYIVDDTGAIADIPEFPRRNQDIYDYGTGSATVVAQ